MQPCYEAKYIFVNMHRNFFMGSEIAALIEETQPVML